MVHPPVMCNVHLYKCKFCTLYNCDDKNNIDICVYKKRHIIKLHIIYIIKIIKEAGYLIK